MGAWTAEASLGWTLRKLRNLGIWLSASNSRCLKFSGQGRGHFTRVKYTWDFFLPTPSSGQRVWWDVQGPPPGQQFWLGSFLSQAPHVLQRAVADHFSGEICPPQPLSWPTYKSALGSSFADGPPRHIPDSFEPTSPAASALPVTLQLLHDHLLFSPLTCPLTRGQSWYPWWVCGGGWLDSSRDGVSRGGDLDRPHIGSLRLSTF